MDISLSNAILTASFSNELPNLITGTIQLAGAQHSISVELKGNFLSDIAGCRIDITNPVPKADHTLLSRLYQHQTGDAGEMTASRRISHTLRKEAPPLLPGMTPPPGSLKNLLFFEWFNPQKQRVLIHAWHWNLEVSPAGWTLPPEAERSHLKATRIRRKAYLLGRDGA